MPKVHRKTLRVLDKVYVADNTKLEDGSWTAKAEEYTVTEITERHTLDNDKIKVKIVREIMLDRRVGMQCYSWLRGEIIATDALTALLLLEEEYEAFVREARDELAGRTNVLSGITKARIEFKP